MELPSAIVTLGTIRHKDSGSTFKQGVWACLRVNPLDMPRTPYRVSEGKHSTTANHALLPHPHPIKCKSFISSMDRTVFIV